MNPGIVQQIFNDHFDSYKAGRRLYSRERYAAWSIKTCRTHEQGYHINRCPNGDYQEVVLNSCKHRSCPQCGATKTEIWLQRRMAAALNCRYFHVVTTIDHSLHIIWQYNRKLFTSLMMRAGWHSLRELLADWRHLGGLPGAVAAFQSWDDENKKHCHVHYIVTAGGLNRDGRWVAAGKELLPTPKLAKKFRGKFLDYLRQGFSSYTITGRIKPSDKILKVPNGMRKQQCLKLLNKLGRKHWHANIEPAYEQAEGVFKYLGHYISRGPISERRIVKYDGNMVTIAYAHRDKHPELLFTVPAKTFIGQLLSHVPEKGTHTDRSYGLFHPNCVDKLNLARKHLGQSPFVPTLKTPSVFELLRKMFKNPKMGLCPRCSKELCTVFIYRGGGAGGLRLAA